MLDGSSVHQGGSALSPQTPSGTGSRGAASSTLSEEERKAVENLIHVIGYFRAIRQTMPIGLVEAFLRVSLQEGLSVSDYMTKLGVAHSVTSRHLLDLSDALRTGEEGMGLLRRRNSLDDLKRIEYSLSDEGRALIRQIARTLTGKPRGLQAP